MKTIILPVDFGDKTSHLVSETVKFAKDMDAKICLIHVAPMDLGFAVNDMGLQYFPDVEKNEINQELLRLHEIQQQITAEGVHCEHILKQGVAKDIILDFAAQKSASYIVMGSHGRSGLYDVFVGSLTKDLTKNSKIPVLVVPIHD